MMLPGVLDGIKIVEFSQNAAIPHCGRLLAGLGADVVKVEPPTGDAMRHLAPVEGVGNEGRAYLTTNPGKRAIVLDLTSPGAKPVVDGLFAWADVALVAMKPPDLARYGIDWDHARTVNPRLVHLTHTALGPEGPAAHHGGYDVLVQGRSGIGWTMNRTRNGVPQSTRPAINDYGTGMVSAFAVMAGLRHRDQTGEGQRIDTSLLGTAMSLATPTVAWFERDAEGHERLQEEMDALQLGGLSFEEQRAHYESRVEAAGGAFRLYFRHYQTADGLISVAGLSAALFQKLHDATGIPRPARMSIHDDEFLATVDAMEAFFAERTSEALLELLEANGYPCGPYNMPLQAAFDEQVRANDFVVDLDHPSVGAYATSGMPISMERSRVEVRGPSPRLGEHTREVMGEIGLDDETVASLFAAGTIAALDD